MKSFKSRAAVLILGCAVFAGCSGGTLRGKTEKSSDGKTYLMVMDDNGGACGPIKVDGKIWPYKIKEKGPIEPGDHIIDCGGEIEFAIPPGVIFKFDYWGP